MGQCLHSKMSTATAIATTALGLDVALLNMAHGNSSGPTCHGNSSGPTYGRVWDSACTHKCRKIELFGVHALESHIYIHIDIYIYIYMYIYMYIIPARGPQTVR